MSNAPTVFPGHALVTGAGRGIGRAIARALGGMGCRVTVNYLRNRDAAQEVVALIRAEGGNAQAIQGDVSHPNAVSEVVTAARHAFGPIAILVNNAGIGQRLSVFEATVEDFDATFAVNVRSAFLVTQAVLQDMRDLNAGRLIFLSSTAAMTGGVISTAYAGSKAAVIGMMHHYAASLLPWNITANAISPAFIDTDIFAGIPMPPAESLPLKRLGRPEEVAEVARMIVTCGFMTGQTIQVNAGRYMT
jgi:3-oxoacyl-[acyl-carrier protein] reductase